MASETADRASELCIRSMYTLTPSVRYPFTLSRSRALRYFSFFYLYVAQGLPSGFALTAFTNYLTAHRASPAVIGSFAAIVGLPWAFQFIWGPVIDHYQSSVIGRRKPWVLAAQMLALLASTGLVLIHDPLHHMPAVSIAFLLHSVFASMQDASVDALAISVTPEKERGRMNAFMRTGYLLGIGVGAAVLSSLLKTKGFHAAALTQSTALLVCMLLTLFLRERADDALFSVNDKSSRFSSDPPDLSYKKVFSELGKGLFTPKNIMLFAAILSVYLGISLFVRAYNYHLIRVLGWEDTDVSFITGSYGMILAGIIALSGGYIVDRFGAQRILMTAMALIAVYLILFSSLSAYWAQTNVARSGLISLYFMDPTLSICAMPVLMSVCRKNVEGSQFTTYMALVNFADIAGSFTSGHLLRFISAPYIGLFSGMLCVGAVALVFFLIRKRGVKTASVTG